MRRSSLHVLLLPPLDSLRFFEAAARHQSFARAAAELHVTASAVAHRVRIEDWRLLYDLGWDADWSYWFARQGLPTPDLSRASGFRLYSMLVQAAVHGIGAAVGRPMLIARELDDQTLVPLFARQAEAPERAASAPDGTRKRVLRYERLGELSRKHAANILMQRVAAANTKPVVAPSTWTFRELAAQWQATVLPMYKPSTQKYHCHILAKHLLPRFGDGQLTELGRQDVQAHVASLSQAGYAPKTVDHIHDVLSAILRTAVKWDHLVDNPARGVDLPPLVTVRPKWALTVPQAANLLEALPALPKTLVGLALLTGVRRGELFALRWRDLDISRQCLIIREAVYEGTFSTPKTTAGLRTIPLSSLATKLAQTWRRQARRTGANDLMFGTRTGVHTPERGVALTH